MAAADVILMTTPEAAEYLRFTPAALEKWRRLETGPPYIRLGQQVRYDRQDLDEYLEGQKITPML